MSKIDGRADYVKTSEITCPYCRYRTEETMPTDACLHFYECIGCGAMLMPEPGDCCVFCSFGTVPCPPEQSDVERDRR